MPDFLHAGIPALGPAHMQAPGGEVDVVPARRHDLRGSEAVAVGDQDGCGVPMPGAVLLGGLHEPLDLSLGEIFAPASANHLPRLEPPREAATFPCAGRADGE